MMNVVMGHGRVHAVTVKTKTFRHTSLSTGSTAYVDLCWTSRLQ